MNKPQPNASEDSAKLTEPLSPDQFAAYYRQLYPRLWLTAAGVIGDRVHADDIVQEAAVIALQKLDQFSVGTNLNAWLGEIVRRCGLNYVRKTRNRATSATDPVSLDRTSADLQPLPPADLNELLDEHQTSFDDEVMRALEAVGETARCCILLRTVQQLTYAEIAQLLGIPEGTAMSHVHRAKTRMREALLLRQDRAEANQEREPHDDNNL